MNKFTYVSQMDTEMQEDILRKVSLAICEENPITKGSTEYNEIMENALHSRLIDLQEVIGIKEYLK
ncbi:hypothetical protein [Oceanobacillus sp. FSL H7-0719]|uniref:hypothetical protein n=1 Tax=Oceanobacillus sp. FSL H7-0719 TaxID=2954507 RepID=UPI003245B6F9